MPTPVTVDLDPWEVEHAHDVGVRRHFANLAKSDKSYYDKARMQENIIASRAAAVAEIAVAKYLGTYWGGHVWDSSLHDRYKNLSDVGPNIEVRRVRTMTSPLIVRERDLLLPDRVVVSVYVDSTAQVSATINGWLPAETAWAEGHDPAFRCPDRDTRAVDYPFLYDIEDLEISWARTPTSA